MRKLKLNLEHLDVETFETDAKPAAKGTVFGEQCTCYTACTCPGCPTCYNTCAQSCNGSCAATCDVSCWYTYCASDPTCNPSDIPGSPCCPY